MIFNFDPPETGWTEGASAVILPDATAPTQPNSLRVHGDGIALRTLSGLSVGQQYHVWARVKFDEAMDGAQIKFTYNEPGAGLNAIITKDFPEPATGWELRYIGLLDYSFANRTFRIYAWPDVGGPFGNRYIDTIYIGEESPAGGADLLSKWTAIENSVEVLKGIDGANSGFTTNFEDRVYSRLFTPPEQPTVKLPYACVPLDQEGERIEYEDALFISSWRLTGFAFFSDNPENDTLNSAGGTSAALFRDDLIRAFMSDQSLSGAVKNCEVTAIETFSGSDGDPTTWVQFTIEFEQYGSRADLEAA
jgi:hypothetical protein